MPRAPRPNATPRPTRRRNGEIITRRVEVGLTPTDDATLAEHLGHRATAGDVRELALTAARMGEKGGDECGHPSNLGRCTKEPGHAGQHRYYSVKPC